MADTLSKAERSVRMSRIRGRDTLPELALRRLLHAAGFRYRLHVAGLPGHPDVVLPRYRAVIFVHGCFWHRHENCRVATMPKSNTAFWMDKFERNVARDAATRAKLESAGWRVRIVWECSLSTKPRAVATAEEVARWIRSGGPLDSRP